MMTMPPEIKCVYSYFYLNLALTIVTVRREKFLRLQHENKMLKLEQSTSSDEQTTVLQSMLDDATSHLNETQSENRLALLLYQS
jgi:hypothetical protein